MVQAGDAHSWPAGIVFGVAGVTDQIDGFLARRWHVESRFGKIADPLADRLMIDAAVDPARRLRAAAVGRARRDRRARPPAPRRLARARAARHRPRRQPARQGRDVAALPRRSAAGSSRTTTRAGRSGSSGSASARAVVAAMFYVRDALERACGDEGRRHGGRRGHAPSPAHVEPAEADGPDRRQAVHGAHPRAAASGTASRT